MLSGPLFFRRILPPGRSHGMGASRRSVSNRTLPCARLERARLERARLERARLESVSDESVERARSRAGFWIGGADSGLRWIAGFEGIDVVPVRTADSRAK